MFVQKQVLILNITRMGDLVQTVPLLARLEQEWPGVAIDLVIDTRFAHMAALLPGLRQVHACDFKNAFKHVTYCVALAYVTDGTGFNGMKTITNVGIPPIKNEDTATMAMDQPRTIHCRTRKDAAARNGHVRNKSIVMPDPIFLPYMPEARYSRTS